MCLYCSFAKKIEDLQHLLHVFAKIKYYKEKASK